MTTITALTESERAIYEREVAALALTASPERHAMAMHAVELDRMTRGRIRPSTANGCSFRKGNAGRPELPTPTNAVELKVACEGEAKRVTGCEPKEDERARMFAFVALSFVSAAGKYVRNGQLGSACANRILGYYSTGPKSWVQRQFSESHPMLCKMAREFGAALRATWEAKA